MLVNHEISVVGQMLTHCRLWQNVRPFYFPLSVKQWSPRTVLTEDEEAAVRRGKPSPRGFAGVLGGLHHEQHIGGWA